MRLNRTLCSSMLACALLVVGGPAFAQEKAPQMSPDAMMEAYHKAAAPGELLHRPPAGHRLEVDRCVADLRRFADPPDLRLGDLERPP